MYTLQTLCVRQYYPNVKKKKRKKLCSANIVHTHTHTHYCPLKPFVKKNKTKQNCYLTRQIFLFINKLLLLLFLFSKHSPTHFPILIHLYK